MRKWNQRGSRKKKQRFEERLSINYRHAIHQQTKAPAPLPPPPQETRSNCEECALFYDNWNPNTRRKEGGGVASDKATFFFLSFHIFYQSSSLPFCVCVCVCISFCWLVCLDDFVKERKCPMHSGDHLVEHETINMYCTSCVYCLIVCTLPACTDGCIVFQGFLVSEREKKKEKERLIGFSNGRGHRRGRERESDNRQSLSWNEKQHARVRVHQSAVITYALFLLLLFLSRHDRNDGGRRRRRRRKKRDSSTAHDCWRWR